MRSGINRHPPPRRACDGIPVGPPLIQDKMKNPDRKSSSEISWRRLTSVFYLSRARGQVTIIPSPSPNQIGRGVSWGCKEVRSGEGRVFFKAFEVLLATFSHI